MSPIELSWTAKKDEQHIEKTHSFFIEKYLFFAASIGAKEPIKGNMHRPVVAVEVLEYEVNMMKKKKAQEMMMMMMIPCGEAYGSSLHCQATGSHRGQAKLPSRSR